MDQGGLFDLQEYTLTVTDVNHAPVGLADYYEVNTNGDFVLDAPGVLANDFDADLDLLTALLRTELPVGNVSLAPDGSLVANMEEFVGTQSFLYQAYDGFTRSEVTAVVFFREVWVQKAKAIVKNNGINWVLKGYSSVPGSMVTIYVGDIADGIELATVTVAGNGVWRYRVRGSDIGPGPSETISVVTGSGFELLGVALEVE
jgi:hypothetical protein